MTLSARCTPKVARLSRQVVSAGKPAFCAVQGSIPPEPTLEGAQATLGEFTLGVGWDLDDQHVAGGPVHDLRWDGAELVALRGA